MKKFNLIYFLICTISLFAQEDTTRSKVRFELNGYLKDMFIIGFEGDFNNQTIDNLIHNRLNFRISPDSNLIFALELRNRIFIGKSVHESDEFAEQVLGNEDLFDLSWILSDNRELGLAAMSEVDRLWIDFSKGDWEIRLGRQRINWGMNLFWNSNDLFNVFSIAEFDYEERPGSDAIRVQKHLKYYQSLDAVVNFSENNNEWIAAMRYMFNKWQYDFQLIGGRWKGDLTLGLGWAGNIKNAGFKGEYSIFTPKDLTFNEQVHSFSTSIDYMFTNQIFLSGGFLINSSGVRVLQSNTAMLFENISAKSLMPSTFNYLLNVAYPISPLWNINLVGIISPEIDNIFTMSSISYSLDEDWEISLFEQSFWLTEQNFQGLGHGMYFRFKWSF